LGFTLRLNASEVAPIRELDPFFLQGTASSSNIFMYLSCKSGPEKCDLYLSTYLTLYVLVLEAPQNMQDTNQSFLYQICISWNINNSSPEIQSFMHGLSNNASRVELIRKIAQQWADPFRSFLLLIHDKTNVKQLDLDDFAPRIGLQSTGGVLLVGDAFHAMSMCEYLLPIRAALQTIGIR
jgi:hypothetical protein